VYVSNKSNVRGWCQQQETQARREASSSQESGHADSSETTDVHELHISLSDLQEILHLQARLGHIVGDSAEGTRGQRSI